MRHHHCKLRSRSIFVRHFVTAIVVLQPQLLEACKDLGLSGEGTKEQLSASILEHFGAEAEEDIKPGEEVMMQQAAKTTARPMPVPPASRPLQRNSDELEAQIKALDATILAKTNELEQLRLDDQCDPSLISYVCRNPSALTL